MSDPAARVEELRKAIAIPDQDRAVREIVKIIGGAYEDAAIMWNNENGYGGDVLPMEDEREGRE